MYPKDTERIYSYFESRVGALYLETTFVGLQYLLKKFLVGPVVTKEGIDLAEQRINQHIGPGVFNRAMWEHILTEHKGYLPIRIRAIPEGLSIPVSNVMMTVENTDPKAYPLTNYLETLLSHVWYPSTVATVSREVKKICKKYLNKTSCDFEGHLPFMLHDFGFRGTSSFQSAQLGGLGHLVNFLGSDTFPAVEAIMDYYNEQEEMPAFSVKATEHSVMTSRGEHGEAQVLRELLKDNPTGILSIVIDSYDYKRFISEYAMDLKELILNREGKVVFRPDSGDPVSVTLDVLKRLNKVFGSEKNEKGFRVLNEKIGVLWGDGIDLEGVEQILKFMMFHSWSSENIVFGMGGNLLQNVTRDTQRHAFKSSAQQRAGVWYDIKKNPLDKTKRSKSGRLSLIKTDTGTYRTVKTGTLPAPNDLLRTVFLNGTLVKEMTFKEVRKNASF
jgi:nicotinamide phosphoribosyltransferase